MNYIYSNISLYTHLIYIGKRLQRIARTDYNGLSRARARRVSAGARHIRREKLVCAARPEYTHHNSSASAAYIFIIGRARVHTTRVSDASALLQTYIYTLRRAQFN